MDTNTQILPSVTIVTDAICKRNPGPGAYAAILSCKNAEKTIAGSEASTTNNRMELTAVVMAVQALKRPSQITILTDSRYVVDGISKWMPNWRDNGWRTASRKAVVNADLWKELDTLIADHDVTAITFQDRPHADADRATQIANDAFTASDLPN